MRPARITALTLVAVLAAAAPGPGDQKPTADLLITNALLVTMDGGYRVIENGAIAVTGSKIAAVGGPEVAARYAAKETLDAGGDIVMPGMINTHTHASGDSFDGLLRFSGSG